MDISGKSHETLVLKNGNNSNPLFRYCYQFLLKCTYVGKTGISSLSLQKMHLVDNKNCNNSRRITYFAISSERVIKNERTVKIVAIFLHVNMTCISSLFLSNDKINCSYDKLANLAQFQTQLNNSNNLGLSNVPITLAHCTIAPL